MEWQIILAIALAIPLIAVPAVFIWYMNVSGLYQVMRDARERRKKRAQALKAAEEPIRR